MADSRTSEADRGDHGPAAGLSDDAGDPLSAPTTVKAVSASTARRIRTDSDATQREAAAMTGDVAGSSFTPRGHDSPLARKLALAAAAAAAAAPTDAERPSLSRQSTVGAGASRGRRRYDRTTTRNLIHGAASDGDLVRLQALLATGSAPSNAPEPNAPDEEEANDGRPASTFALANEPNPHSGLAPIHLAAQNGHEDVVKWLVEEAGALPDFEDAGGETPLHKAALRGHLDVCRFLLSRQVDINAADNDGWTPLHNAASRGWLDVAQLLTTFRADPDVQNRHGFTPLMNAASKGHLPLVHFLLRQAGAEPLRRNIWGETAFDLAASVFELEICRALAAAEERAMLSESATTLQTEDSPRRRRYNPLALHATVPVVLYENQRLVTPSMRRPASLVPGQGDALSWSSGALTRNDQRPAFSLPDMLGFKASEAAASGTELPCFKSEVGLPVVGKENELVLPPQRQVRSGGRVQAEPQRPGPTPRRSSSRSSVSGSAASPPSTPSLDDESTSNAMGSRVAPRPEPAWMWISEWTVDRTAPTSSPIDCWSYAPSFDTPAEEWTAAPPIDASGPSILSTSASGARKWVRRRLWTRVMRRRVDLPDWGFDDEPQRTGDSSEQLQDLARVGYRARARYFAGASLPELDPTEAGALDDADHRKAIAQLERAVDELRQGLTEEADETTRREAQAELEEYLRLLAPLQSRDDGSDGTPSEEAAFVYSGVDAEEDDARSIWTSMRSPSVASSAAGGGQLGSRTASFQSTHSNRPVLTAQSAPEFRIPTNELAAPSRSHASPQLQSQSLRPPWEPDHATNACRRCSKHFSLLNRRHHCRRCGLVVCSACSPHSDRLDPRQVAIEPGTVADDSPWLLDSPAGYRYRTCNDCHAALALIPSDQAGPSSLLSPQAFFPASPSLPGSAAPSEAAASDVSELAECPVCGETLAQLGDKVQQESHIRECLEAGKGMIASGRYLLFRLPAGPLVGEDCNICWTEFEIGDRMARLVCLCTFHEKCLSGWLARGNSCPVHALRE